MSRLKKISAIIFVTSFSVCLATVNYFNNFYAKNALERDAEYLLYQFHDALVKARQVLDSLPGPDEFVCNEQTLEKLAALAYKHSAVRLIGVFHDKKQACASESLQLDLSNYHERLFHENNSQLADNLSLATAEHNDGSLDFFMVRSHLGSRYFASINPLMINYLSEFACTECMEYDFVIDGLPKLEFRSQVMTGASFAEYESFRYEDSIKVYLYLRGNAEFYNYYKELSWVSTILFACIFAIITSIIAYRLMNIRQSLERIIKDAIKLSEFVPFYQPIVDSRTGEVVGAEVLARWRHKDGYIVPPYQFIPFAEDSGLIIDITVQLIEKVCADTKALNWQPGKQFMSINIVPEHLDNNELLEIITKESNKNNISEQVLSLEITERKKIDDLAQARKRLDTFYEKGIELKLDDAGTGYGGFSYIQELGISALKIDKMFVDTIASDDVKSSVLDAIILFASSSNLKMIAEGVEEASQVEYLKGRNVFFIQGYVYGKPMPIEEFQQWIKKR